MDEEWIICVASEGNYFEKKILQFLQNNVTYNFEEKARSRRA